MIFFFYNFCRCGINGVEFSSDGKTIISTPTLLENFEVPNEVEIINGGDSVLQSSFIKCSKSIKTIKFTKGSMLKKIYPYVFSESTLTSIDLSPCTSLRIIEKGVFYKCTKLENVLLPEGIETISLLSLQGLDSIKKIKIPDSVKTIEGDGNGGGALQSPFDEITITPNSLLETIGESAFFHTKVTSFYIPKNLKNIRGAFQGTLITHFDVHTDNQNLTFKDGFLLSKDSTIIWQIAKTTQDVVIPSYVKVLEYFAGNNNDMKSVTFEGKIDEWRTGHTFSSTSIVNFTFPEGLKEVAWAAFLNCQSLKSVTFSKDIVKIGNSAFLNCVSLTDININDQITVISSGAFQACTSLKHFKCPKQLTTFGEGVFSQCTGLQFDSNGNTKFSVYDDILYTDGIEAREYFLDGGDVIIRDFCQRISNSIFVEKKLTSITIKSNVNLTIGVRAFSTSTLTRIELPLCLSALDWKSFASCYELKEVIFNKDCKCASIPDECFINCYQLSTIVFPTCLTSIDKRAFEGCVLTIQNLHETNLITIGKLAFSKSNITEIRLGPSLSSIGEEAFLDTSIETVVLEDNSMDLVMASVFKNCKSLSSFTFSNSIENISSFAFSRCYSLKSIILPNSINIIKPNAFEYCNFLESVTIPLNSKLEIRGQAFFNCLKLVKFVVSNEDTKFSFNNGVLMNKEKTKIVLFLPSSKKTIYVVPAMVKEIGNYAFQDCKNLRTVIIPEGDIDQVGYQSFDGCTSLSSLYMARTLTKFGDHVFDRCPKLNQCGSVVYEKEDKSAALNAGIPKIAFNESCPNIEKSTACLYIKVPLAAVAAVLVLD